MEFILYTHEYPPFCGGAGEYIHNIFSAEHPKNDFKVLTTKYKKSDLIYPDSEESYLIRFTVKKNKKSEYVRGIIKLFFVVFKNRCFKIIAGDTISQRVTYFLSFILPIKYIVVSFGSEVNWNFSGNFIKIFLLKGLYKRSLAIIACSVYTEKLLKKYGVSTTTSAINPGISKKEYSSPKNTRLINKVKEAFSLEEDKVIIISLSRLDKRKGHDVIIGAIEKLVIEDNLKNILYVIGGKGNELENIKTLIKQKRLGFYVKLPGYISDELKISLLDVCDIFILASREEKGAVEGFGISYIEAGARGKPVIAGNTGGVSEAVIDNVTGFLCNPNSVDDIADRLKKLIKNKHLREKMGNSAKDFVLKSKTWEISRKKMFEKLRSIGFINHRINKSPGQ